MVGVRADANTRTTMQRLVFLVIATASFARSVGMFLLSVGVIFKLAS